MKKEIEYRFRYRDGRNRYDVCATDLTIITDGIPEYKLGIDGDLIIFMINEKYTTSEVEIIIKLSPKKEGELFFYDFEEVV